MSSTATQSMTPGAETRTADTHERSTPPSEMRTRCDFARPGKLRANSAFARIFESISDIRVDLRPSALCNVHFPMWCGRT